MAGLLGRGLVAHCAREIRGSQITSREEMAIAAPIPDRMSRWSLAVPAQAIASNELEWRKSVARKKPSRSGFVAFDVLYEDGSRSSNRRVASDELDGFDGDDAAKAIIEAQDRKVAALSGKAPLAIKSLNRSSGR
jgi:hypothetical protein